MAIDLSKDAAINEAIQRRSYQKAIDLIRAELRSRFKNERLRLQLASVLAVAGDKKEAVEELDSLAGDLARDGFAAKAIAVLKKVQRIEPSRTDIEDRLSQLVQQKAPRPAEAWAPPPPPPEMGMELGFEPAPREEQAARVAGPPEGSLVETPLFSSFSREEALEVIRGLRLLSFEPGAIIITQGEPGGSLFVVTTGLCRAFVRNQQGRNVEVRQLKEGDFFGEISLLTGESRTATVTAAARCELLELDKGSVDRVSVTHPRVREVLQQFYRLRKDSTLEVMAQSMGIAGA